MDKKLPDVRMMTKMVKFLGESVLSRRVIANRVIRGAHTQAQNGAEEPGAKCQTVFPGERLIANRYRYIHWKPNAAQNQCPNEISMDVHELEMKVKETGE